MRLDPPGVFIAARFRDPRNVIAIIYPTGSIYLTNRTGLTNVPGNVVQGVLVEVSASSQTLAPDERRTTIGSLSFTAVDLGGAITDEIRDQLLNQSRGIRRREVRVYTGDTDDFNDYRRVDTYVIDGVALEGTSYVFTSADRSREQRVEIFDQAKTRAASTVSAGASTINVLDTTDFSMVAHTAAFSDAPSATVGYIRIPQVGAIIRYTGKTPTSFTGCTWERFGTQSLDVEVTATEDDKKPEVEEVIYLEGPVPQLDYAIKTGLLLSSGAAWLPDTWHMGMDAASVGDDDWTNIGADLYDASDLTAGVVLRFTHLKKTDGKRFCEEQLHVPMGTYCVPDTMGVLRLKRLASIVGDAAPVDILFPNNVIEYGEVVHAQQRVINQVVIDWNYDGETESFTRHDVLYNAESIGDGETGHGAAPPLILQLRGLTVARHTASTLRRIANYYFERYGAPPIELTIKASRAKNNLEVGDVVRLVLPGVRDYTALAYLDRAFEIVSRRVNWHTGDVGLTLFGSSLRTRPNGAGGSGAILADAWYESEGTELSTVLTISAGHVTANGTLTGDADLRDGVFYYDGDLTVDAGVTVSIDDNVQLRVRGVLTINGTISGDSRGLAAIADVNTFGGAYVDPPFPTEVYTLGSTRGSQSLYIFTDGSLRSMQSVGLAGYGALSPFALEVDASGNLLGMPSELRGTPGLYGMPVVEESANTVDRLGGDGGDGGAGLAIVCRGLVFGLAGVIDLSGEDGTAASGSVSTPAGLLAAGGGGGGSAGGLLVLLDGDSITYPDLTDAFVAMHGATTQTGSPVFASPPDPLPGSQPYTGWDAGLGAADMFSAAHVIQYVPAFVPGDDQDQAVPAPTDLAAAVDGVGVNWTWEPGAPDASDYTQLWVATTNDRTGAVLVSRRKSSSAYIASDAEVDRFGWVRNFKQGLGYSAWHPTSSTGGVAATYGGSAGTDGEDAITVAVSPAFAQWRRAPNGGSISPSGTTCDITFLFLQGGVTIATHIVRVTRSTDTLTAATQSESGDATVESIVGSGTSVLTVLVTHTASSVTGAQSISVVLGGDDGAPGVDGDDGADGLDSWTPVLTANMSRTGRSFTKTGSAGSWDAGFYSAERFGACQITFQPAQANLALMIGLNVDPTTNASYTSMDYALYCGGGTLAVYESGVAIGIISGSYSAGDALAVQYDGQHVRYLLNGVVLRSVSDGGKRFYADSSFYDLGSVENVVFSAIPMGKIDLTTQVFNALSTAFAAAGLINANISVNADGSLVGAGGGAPTISSLSGSVATGQLTANVVAALQAVIGNLAAIHADLGTITAGNITLAAGGYLRSPAISYDGNGVYIGYDGGEAAFSVRQGSNYLRYKPSVGYPEYNGVALLINSAQTFTPGWPFGFSSAPSGNISYLNFGAYAAVFCATGPLGTSNANTMVLDGLPAAIQPSGRRIVPCLVVDDGAVGYGSAILNPTAGSEDEIWFLMSNDFSSAKLFVTLSGFATSGDKGLPDGFMIFYPK